MMKEADEEETGGAFADVNDILAQYQTTRVRFWSNYKRIFQITKTSIITLDPSKFTVTNTFPFERIARIGIDEKDKQSDQFSFEVNKTVYTFRTAYRAHLLCQLFENLAKLNPVKYKLAGPFESQRIRKNQTKIDCKLSVSSYGIIETGLANNVLQVYRWINISRIGVDAANSGLFFEATGRTKIFYTADIEKILNASKYHIRELGIESLVQILSKMDFMEMLEYRRSVYDCLPTPVSTFDVNKVTKRSRHPMPRQLMITEDYVIEKDASGFQCVSFQRIDAIYAIVRSWSHPREFTIEFNDESSRTFTCAVRDTLLAMLLDVCHAGGNLRVIVTGEVSDGLRLMPRFAEEDYHSSIKDAFFGASSIEAWFLTRLAKVCKATTIDSAAVEQACRDLNANVPCPGISPHTDVALVRTAVTGVIKTLYSALYSAYSDERLDNSRTMTTLLQALFRIIPCSSGYKCFVEVKEVDTRQLLLQLLKFEHDFVNYWTLEVLMVLCRCPLHPRNFQQEFVNKHTLLNDKMLTCLIDLMSHRTDTDDFLLPAEDTADNNNNDASEQPAASISVSDGNADDSQPVTAASTQPEPTAPKSTLLAHLPSMDVDPAAREVTDNSRHSRKIMFSTPKETPDTSIGDINWTPNSLVVIGAAALLEAIVCSGRDTSSPELLNQLLDMLSGRCEVFISMLRSTSFLIMENAAILMYTVAKHRPKVGPLLKELALSDCLVLKHFYNAVFSPSSTQRFISRFLIATWMSGGAKSNPGKTLLLRLIPTGLTEYLKFAAITEEHRANLDELEEEFYSNFLNTGTQGSKLVGNTNLKHVGKGAVSVDVNEKSSSSVMETRMRTRIASALKEQQIDKTASNILFRSKSENNSTISASLLSASDSESLSPATISNGFQPNNGSTYMLNTASNQSKQPENYRIMFHMVTKDHKLPDLIWNDQTRLELRSTLEMEIREFEREQRLRGNKKIAWNYQQFSVQYESLREELQVGPIYIRHFLDAGDSFLKSLENPSHIVLFEKLFRRMLVNVERSPQVSTLCVKCISRLYEVCSDKIGKFDDMLILVRMLSQATNMELQHTLIDFVELLCRDDSNLHQLLDKSFVDLIIQYATLAHLNPDQIGNMLARATSNVLLLKNASEQIPSGVSSSTVTGNIDEYDASRAVDSKAADKKAEEEELNKQLKRSLWVPDDIACPQVWFVAPRGSVPPPKQLQKGPYRVTELLLELDRTVIDSTWQAAPSVTDESDGDNFESIVDTGRWKPIQDYFQLRLQMLFPGKAMYSPADIATKSLRMLQKVAAVHRSANSKGVPFYPIPMSKKVMSECSHLAIFAQLLLSNNGSVVETAADLIGSLVQFNALANSKLYLTGCFFFACRYTGNNFNPLAWLFYVSHLQQGFHDAAASVARDLPISARSVLGSMLPAAMVSMLHNYGPDKFATIFTGDFDTPEVIWNAELRRHMVEMIDQHLGDFPARLRQHTLSAYEYCPMPKIHYKNLDKEIYVHEYYLRNFCDETRFPDWPVGQPLLLLRETIERWRAEMEKGVVDNSVSEAKRLLCLGDRYSNTDLRKAYKTLARQYHPDKNPNGRDMFERIHVAYELLSSVELQMNQTDLSNVVLLLKAQIIVYRRFAKIIRDQKYPAFPLLLKVMSLPILDPPAAPVEVELVVAGTKLMFYTCTVSPLNANEFVKSGAVTKLFEVVSYAIKAYQTTTLQTEGAEILLFAVKTFTSIANIEHGRSAIEKLCPGFAENVYSMLSLHKSLPIVVENCIEVISRCCSSAQLQTMFVSAGVIWRLAPFLLAYDGTLQDTFEEETQREVHNQKSCNMHAILTMKALGRLGGYMFDDLKTDRNEDVQHGLDALLTGPLAKLLRNRRPWELLGALNENVEKVTKIWNVGMRQELLDYVQLVDSERPAGSDDNDLARATDFQFTALREELCVGGVYVRIFNKHGEVNDIDEPSAFCRALVAYIWPRISSGPSCVANCSTLARVHLDYAVEALKMLSEALGYIAYDIAKCPNGIDTVFRLLEQKADSAAFLSATQLLSILCGTPDFVTMACKHASPCVWRLLYCLCTVSSAPVAHAWAAAESLASTTDGMDAMLGAGAVIQLLGVLLGVTGYTKVYQSRLSAIALLGKFLWNPVKGANASNMLRRFIPEPVVLLLRGKAGAASLQLLDTACENPELIWTLEMQNELRASILALLDKSDGGARNLSDSSDATVAERHFSSPPNVAAEYVVRYRQLSTEIYLGGVYIRLFLKQPTFRLSNPVLFLEKLVECWENAFAVQVKDSGASGMSDSKAVVLGQEDFVSLLTSCIVCVVKGEETVVDHLLSWGFVQSMCEMLKRTIIANRRGAPMVSIVRLLHVLVKRIEVVDSLATAKVDIVKFLTLTLNNDSSVTRSVDTVKLNRESALIVELLKRIFQCTASRSLSILVSNAIAANLVNFLLDHVLSATAAKLGDVRNPSALRIHSVDLLKAIVVAGDEDMSAVLQALLDVHPSWNEFKHQSHDLFITDQEKTDVYLIQDSIDSKFAGLLTDGKVSGGISEVFSSTGAPSAYSAQGSEFGLSSSFRRQSTLDPKKMPTVNRDESEERAVLPSAIAKAFTPSATIAAVANPGKSIRTQATEQASSPVNAASAPVELSNASQMTERVQTMVAKGEQGIGLDLGKDKLNRAMVLRLKDSPPGSVNPATLCNPPIFPGDIIIGVNGADNLEFADVVKAIRASNVRISLSLERVKRM